MTSAARAGSSQTSSSGTGRAWQVAAPVRAAMPGNAAAHSYGSHVTRHRGVGRAGALVARAVAVCAVLLALMAVLLPDAFGPDDLAPLLEQAVNAAYARPDINLRTVAVVAIGADTVISVVAGLAVFPVVFANDLDPAEGPGLVFVALPLAFSAMPAGTESGMAIVLVEQYLTRRLGGVHCHVHRGMEGAGPGEGQPGKGGRRSVANPEHQGTKPE